MSESENGKVFNIFVWPQILITDPGLRGRRHRNGDKIAYLKSFEDASAMFPTIVDQLKMLPDKKSIGPGEMYWNGELIKIKIRRVF